MQFWSSDWLSHYTMLSKYVNCTRLLKLKIGCFYK